jgi:hypothetical protein
LTCLMISGDEYKLWSSSLCNFLHSPVTSTLLGPNILLRTLFSNTLSLCSSLSVRDQFSHQYKTTGRIMVCVYFRPEWKSEFRYCRHREFNALSPHHPTLKDQLLELNQTVIWNIYFLSIFTYCLTRQGTSTKFIRLLSDQDCWNDILHKGRLIFPCVVVSGAICVKVEVVIVFNWWQSWGRPSQTRIQRIQVTLDSVNLKPSIKPKFITTVSFERIVHLAGNDDVHICLRRKWNVACAVCSHLLGRCVANFLPSPLILSKSKSA